MRIGHVVSFIVGGGLGSLVTWYVLKDKYAKLAQEEIDSVKETFEQNRDRIQKHREELKSEKAKENRDKKAKEVQNYAGEVNRYGYSDISTAQTRRWQDSNADPRNPYIISPMEFEDEAYSHYESVELTYYADGVLADMRDEVITQQDSYETIGPDIFRSIRDHFGEYEDDPDVVYVRNEMNMIHYVITRDRRTYADCVGDMIGS